MGLPPPSVSSWDPSLDLLGLSCSWGLLEGLDGSGTPGPLRGHRRPRQAGRRPAAAGRSRRSRPPAGAGAAARGRPRPRQSPGRVRGVPDRLGEVGPRGERPQAPGGRAARGTVPAPRARCSRVAARGGAGPADADPHPHPSLSRSAPPPPWVAHLWGCGGGVRVEPCGPSSSEISPRGSSRLLCVACTPQAPPPQGSVSPEASPEARVAVLTSLSPDAPTPFLSRRFPAVRPWRRAARAPSPLPRLCSELLDLCKPQSPFASSPQTRSSSCVPISVSGSHPPCCSSPELGVTLSPPSLISKSWRFSPKAVGSPADACSSPPPSRRLQSAPFHAPVDDLF